MNAPTGTSPFRLVCLACLLLALAALAEAKPISAVVINPDVQSEINEEHLRLMLTGKKRFWSEGTEVVVAILKSDPHAEEALRRYCGMSAIKFKNHWQRLAFSGRGKMPKMFASIDDLAEFVRETRGAIGIVSVETEIEGLRHFH